MFLSFYCLPIWKTVAALFLVLLLWCVLSHRCSRAGPHLWVWKILCGVGTLLWIIAILYVTLLSRSAGDGAVYLLPFHQLLSVLRGGNPEILRSAWMNVLLFVPPGMLLPELFPADWPLSRRLLVTGLVSMSFSTGIELMQWCWTLGTAETDDVLANTLGAIIGVLGTHLGRAYLSQCKRFW